MRVLHVLIMCLTVIGTACDNAVPVMNPVAPTGVVSASPPPSSPTPACPSSLSSFPADPFSERYTWTTVGQAVSGRFAAADPPCDGFHCQYFRLTPPTDGMLDVEMTYSLGTARQVLDLSLSDPQSRIWWAPLCVPVSAGTTYQITVWYGTPGVEFELRASLR